MRSDAQRQFQSLDRAYKRSDEEDIDFIDAEIESFNPSIGLTSVPTSFIDEYIPTCVMFQSLDRRVGSNS